MHTAAGPSRRRLCLGVAALAGAPSWRLAAAATRRVGFISAANADEAAEFLSEVRADLARRGHAVPDSLALDLRFAEGDLALIPKFVAELERSQAAVIVTHAVATTLVVKTPRAVPVVYQFSADPVSAGIAADLAHPLFNATGVTLMLAELNGKRLEFLQQILPGMRRLGILANALHPGQERERAVVEEKARQ